MLAPARVGTYTRPPMVEYLDSSRGGRENALGNWLAATLIAGARSFRCQTGFFSLASLRDHLGTLQGVEVLRLVLGSNTPEEPTVEDIRALLPLLTDPSSRSLTIVSCAGGALFHPKTIHLAGPDGVTRGYVGSANMTGAGLGLNIEAGVSLGPENAEALEAMATAIDSWTARTEDGVFHVCNGDDLDTLLVQGVLQTAAQRRATRTANRAGEGIRHPVPRLRRDRLWSPAARTAVAEAGEDAAEPVVEATSGQTGGSVEHLRWCKMLRRSDAQQVSAGTNPTGKLRLAQAHFPIDQQRYFREDFFGDATWAAVERRGTLYEECSVPFRVSIHGEDLGEQVLRVDHAPHRAANQGNVPTVLGWGPVLGRHLREVPEINNWVVLERDEDGAYSLAITDQRPDWAP